MSGHADCEIPDCQTCKEVGVEVQMKCLVAKSFLDGTLKLVDQTG
jgi:hypothetical protein